MDNNTRKYKSKYKTEEEYLEARNKKIKEWQQNNQKKIKEYRKMYYQKNREKLIKDNTESRKIRNLRKQIENL